LKSAKKNVKYIFSNTEKERVRQIISPWRTVLRRYIDDNASVPMIGLLELAIGRITSHASWAWLTNISPGSQIILRRLRADLDLIVNEFKQIVLIW